MTNTIELPDLSGHTVQYPKYRLAFRPAAYALIVQDGKLLVVESRQTGKLFLPGGGVEKGETMPETLQRELHEETGLEIEIVRFLRFKEFFFYYALEDQGFHSLLFYYLCRTQDTSLPAPANLNDADTTNPRWVPVADLKPADFHTNGDTIVQLLGELED